MKPSSYHRLLLLVILLAGLSLRLVRLGGDSLWYDETVSTYLAGQSLPELIRHTAGDIHPPGYYILLRGWLLLMGYGDGRADPHGNGLEFTAGFFSLFFGVLLCALIYHLAYQMTEWPSAALAAGLVALSPYHVWYSQEVRMYTLGAALGVIALHALLKASGFGKAPLAQGLRLRWWVLYGLVAAAGMYTLYYFAFLLLPLNLWTLALLAGRGRAKATQLGCWLLANAASLLLYLPWLPIAWRQATDPPVPPWRTAVGLAEALREAWTALTLGQSAPSWTWPVMLVMVGLYLFGLFVLASLSSSPPSSAYSGHRQDTAPAVVGTRGQRLVVGWLIVPVFGPLALILLASAVTPLYHVRYLFTYSPAFYIPLAAGIWGLWSARVASYPRWVTRAASMLAASLWLIGVVATLQAAWTSPLYRADDHRAAVCFLEEHWRPGDVVLVNAGYTYTALLTYWQGPVAYRGRITETLPSPRDDAALIAVTTGHLDGPPTLGWGDPRSDFFALPSAVAAHRIESLFQRFPRVWHYRIYDTVNDPDGRLRAWLTEQGQLVEERLFAGEANMRVQGYVSRLGAEWRPDRMSVEYDDGLKMQWEPLVEQAVAGETIYPVVTWLKTQAGIGEFSTSLRLIGPDGAVWSQPMDERPLGSLFRARQWPTGVPQRQPLALPIPPGTPPGQYTVTLLAYASATGQPLEIAASHGLPLTPHGLVLGQLSVLRLWPAPAPRKVLAVFGPLALIEASSPATVIAPGGQVPVELLWQALRSPGEPFVVVVQLLNSREQVIAGLEAQPLAGRYPTSEWLSGELVRDRHTLDVPVESPPGHYRLIVGIYRAADRVRLTTRFGLWGQRTYHVIKTIEVK